MNNFDIFIGLKDHIEYLIFSNKNNYNLDIMRIRDKMTINSLKGHNSPTRAIRYFLKKDNNNDYILSCDNNKFVIVWDVQNYYNKIYTIQNDYNSDDGLLLFNIFNNNYIILTNDSFCYSKLYELKENTKFIRNIYDTNKNCYPHFMIPWFYQNKYYIIYLCYENISINNIFEDECYAILSQSPETHHYFGYLYNNNYLCVSDNNCKFIRIWDLVHKKIWKQINYDDSKGGLGIIQWNNIYTIVAGQNCLIIINIEEKK